MTHSPEDLDGLKYDALKAWNSGQQFYAITISTATTKDSELLASTKVDSSHVFVLRNQGLEESLAAIKAIGWKLHSWNFETRTQSILTITQTNTIFVRP